MRLYSFVLASAAVIGLYGCSEPSASPPPTAANSSASATDFGAEHHGDHDHAANGSEDLAKVKEELAKLSKADRESAEGQQVCPVSDEMLGPMGAPSDWPSRRVKSGSAAKVAATSSLTTQTNTWRSMTRQIRITSRTSAIRVRRNVDATWNPATECLIRAAHSSAGDQTRHRDGQPAETRREYLRPTALHASSDS